MIREITIAQDTEDHVITIAQDTEDHVITIAQDTVVKEMTEAQDTIEIQEVEALGLTEMIMVLDLIEILKIIDAEKHTKQLVVIVETNVKYHSNQNMTDLFIAKNVSKITNPKNIVVALDLTEDQVMVETTEAQDTEDHEITIAQDTVVKEITEAQDTIKVNLNSKETVLQFTVEIILKQQNIRQIVMNPIEKILGMIILIHFILLSGKNYLLY